VPYADRNLTCVDCNSQFVFTAGEQEFHSSKGFSNDPRRCPSCRQSRKSSRNDSSGDRPRSSTVSSGSGGGFGSGMPRREMYDAVCAECGKDTQVPFQPSGSRPVYCRDCFSQHSGGGGGGGRSSYGGGGGGGGGGRSSRSARY
jgi:CxxC-x17-CxxC domain-containing protein